MVMNGRRETRFTNWHNFSLGGEDGWMEGCGSIIGIKQVFTATKRLKEGSRALGARKVLGEWRTNEVKV